MKLSIETTTYTDTEQGWIDYYDAQGPLDEGDLERLWEEYDLDRSEERV